MRSLPWVHAVLVAAIVFLAPRSEIVHAQVGPGIVISELRTRGVVNSDEFIEIFNPTSEPVNIGDWTILASDAIGGTMLRATVPHGYLLNSGCYYLVTHETGYRGLIPGDLTYVLSLSDTGGVAIADASGALVDQVGFSAGSAYKEPPTLAPLLINGDNSYERKPGGEAGHADTNNNEADFRLRSVFAIPPEPANPQNSQSPCISVVEPDVEAPVFDPEPEDVEAEATSPDGAVVIYDTPTATDNVDPQVAVSCAPLSGSVFPLGNTDVLCSAEDTAGNAAEAAFTISVRDTTRPEVAVPADITREATSAAPQVVTYDASASDAVTVDPPVLCSPASGSAFPLGVTLVTCRATDAAGNVGEAAFRVTIQDTTAPLLTVPANVVAEAIGPEGAVVYYGAAIAIDAVDGAVPVTCAPASGSVFPLGDSSVACVTSDASGNAAAAELTITVRDTTAPILLVPGNISDSADSAAGRIVDYSVSASDAVTAVPTITCSPASGSMFALGTTTVNCQASDDAGNSSAAVFTVTIGEPVLGRMHGAGEISSNGKRVTFMFDVRESANFVERGQLMLVVKDQGRAGRLVVASVADVRLSQAIDSVAFTAYGPWYGKTGYRFDVAAHDLGEPGNGVDTLEVTVTAPNGDVVERLSGVLIAGNIQGR